MVAEACRAVAVGRPSQAPVRPSGARMGARGGRLGQRAQARGSMAGWQGQWTSGGTRDAQKPLAGGAEGAAKVQERKESMQPRSGWKIRGLLCLFFDSSFFSIPSFFSSVCIYICAHVNKLMYLVEIVFGELVEKRI
ncbi:unnamed protein product [Urochloa humidicola]